MSATFDVFDYLAYIVPGTVFLFALMWLSPSLKAPFVEEEIDLGSFGVFVIMAFVAGQLLLAISSYFPEWPMRYFGWVHRTNQLVCSNQTIFGKVIVTEVGAKLHENMQQICQSDNPDLKRGVLREIFATVSKAPDRDRVNLFERRYHFH